MADNKQQNIYGWSTNPSQNQKIGDVSWYEGMPPRQVNNSGRGMMGQIAAYVADQTYANENITFGATNIQITLQTNLAELVPGMAVKFAVKPDAPACPDAPLLCINNLPPDKRGGANGDGLPIVYEAFDPISGSMTIQRATSAMFGGGALITAIYRPDIKLWDIKALSAEQQAKNHLKGDVQGLLKADSEWQKYADDIGCFMLIDATGAQSAGTMLELVLNRLLVGSISWFDADEQPLGWLICDGRSIKDADYPLLVKLLNKRHGGDLNNTTLPDLRGRFIRGADLDGQAATAEEDRNTLGKVQADKVGAFELKGQTGEAGSDAKGGTQQISKLMPGSADGGDKKRGILQSSWDDIITVSTGGSGLPKHSHDVDIKYSGYETRPKNIALLPCIFAGLNSVAAGGKKESGGNGV